MNYFIDCSSVEEIKKLYKDLARKHHPDLGGSTAVMQEINNQYEKALKGCDGQTTVGDDGKTHTYKWDEQLEKDLAKKIFDLLSLDMNEVDIYLVGLWVWISGDTKPYRSQLKELNCRWHSKRGCWYFAGVKSRYSTNSGKGFDDLATKYGATKLRKENNPKQKRIS